MTRLLTLTAALIVGFALHACKPRAFNDAGAKNVDGTSRAESAEVLLWELDGTRVALLHVPGTQKLHFRSRTGDKTLVPTTADLPSDVLVVEGVLNGGDDITTIVVGRRLFVFLNKDGRNVLSYDLEVEPLDFALFERSARNTTYAVLRTVDGIETHGLQSAERERSKKALPGLKGWEIVTRRGILRGGEMAIESDHLFVKADTGGEEPQFFGFYTATTTPPFGTVLTEEEMNFASTDKTFVKRHRTSKRVALSGGGALVEGTPEEASAPADATNGVDACRQGCEEKCTSMGMLDTGCRTKCIEQECGQDAWTQ
jgi:hypothetical protein